LTYVAYRKPVVFLHGSLAVAVGDPAPFPSHPQCPWGTNALHMALLHHSLSLLTLWWRTVRKFYFIWQTKRSKQMLKQMFLTLIQHFYLGISKWYFT